MAKTASGAVLDAPIDWSRGPRTKAERELRYMTLLLESDCLRGQISIVVRALACRKAGAIADDLATTADELAGPKLAETFGVGTEDAAWVLRAREAIAKYGPPPFR